MSMENDICTAYTYIEFSGNYKAYCKALAKYHTDSSDTKTSWEEVVKNYLKLSEFMSDEAITQAQEAVMGLY